MFSAPIWSRGESLIRTSFCLPPASSASGRSNVSLSKTAQVGLKPPSPPGCQPLAYVPPTIFATATILDCATQAPCIWRTHGQTSSASRISFSGARLVGRRRQGAEDQDHRRSRRPTRDDAWDRDLGHHRSAQVRQSGVLTRAGQTAYGSRVATH